MSTTHERIMAARPVNKQTALQIVGGDQSGRDELLCDQAERYAHAMKRAEMDKLIGATRATAELERALDALSRLTPGTFPHTDMLKRVERCWRVAFGPNAKVNIGKALKHLRRRKLVRGRLGEAA